MKSKRKFSAEFKAKVAIEAIKQQETVSEIAVKYQIHPNQISEWKRQFLENAELVFTEKAPDKKHEKQVQQLYEEIGRLQSENTFLKKKL